MQSSNAHKLAQYLEKLEKELEKKVVGIHSDSNKSEKIENLPPIERIEQILEKNSELSQKLINHKSPRKIVGRILDFIRKKFYKEVDEHIKEVLTTQELYNIQTLNYLKSLRKDILDLRSTLNQDNIQISSTEKNTKIPGEKD
ncbi:hypothetical protein KKG71_03535 [Patescibacteria group bacterium]|nr:hypothetical protein [Patescibacteria group bacterium]